MSEQEYREFKRQEKKEKEQKLLDERNKDFDEQKTYPKLLAFLFFDLVLLICFITGGIK